MIGALIFIYFVGKAFYDLAGKYGKNQIGFAILGVVSYYGGLYSFAFIIGIVLAFMAPELLDTNELVFTLLMVPFGFLTCWLTYYFLKRSWSRPKDIGRGTLDSDLISGRDSPYNRNSTYNKNER